ncbi:substrate-binding domain-containing protein [Streptomyces sp. NPDC058466]|uniref:substrate-binding domain-containing protein n=1 Tax=Streptomyces sp. NPDC058466 TaxID=3346512 RepID=UPI0036574CCF
MVPDGRGAHFAPARPGRHHRRARRAGHPRKKVSPSVVSYVLNQGPRPVAPATRERVLAAVRELGYRPKSAARALRLSHTMTLGLVVPDLANPFFAELAMSLEDHAWAAGYTLLVGNSAGSAERETTYIQTFLDRQVEGLLLSPAHRGQPWQARLARTGVPSVAVDHEARAASIFHVLVDNVCGAHQATEHLLRHGRRRIGCTAGQLGLRTTTDRVTGWRTALEAAGLRAGSGSGGRTGWRPAAAPLLHGSYGRLEGYRAALALLAHDRLVDALFATSDVQAAGVLRAAHELGIRIPGDSANQISKDAPPTLIVQGFRDHLVFADHTEGFADKLTTAGVTHSYVELPFMDHAYDSVSADIGTKATRALTLPWLQEYVGG